MVEFDNEIHASETESFFGNDYNPSVADDPFPFQLYTPKLFNILELKLLVTINGRDLDAVIESDLGYTFLKLCPPDSVPQFFRIDGQRFAILADDNVVSCLSAHTYLTGLIMSNDEIKLSDRIRDGEPVVHDEEYYYIGDTMLSIEKFRFYYGYDVDCPCVPALTLDELSYLSFAARLEFDSQVLKNDDGTIVLKMEGGPKHAPGVSFSRSAINKLKVNRTLSHRRAKAYLDELILSGEEAMLIYQAIRGQRNYTLDDAYYRFDQSAIQIPLEKYRHYFGDTHIRAIRTAQFEEHFTIVRSGACRVESFKPLVK